jgi:lipocalin
VVNRQLMRVAAVVLFAITSAAAIDATQSSRGQEYTGTWSGTWDGSGSGEFELTLEQTKDSALGGRVAVTTDGGNYTAELKSVAFDGTKMTASYEFPLDPSAEVAISATFDNRTAKGTWLLHPKGQAAEIASGTWTVTRK